MTQTDLVAIERSSRANNDAAGLTGFLLHQFPRFYGVLEGSSCRLFARMERIATDPRHCQLRILREDSIQRRRFENWTFGSLPSPAQHFGTDGPPRDFLRTLSRKP